MEEIHLMGKAITRHIEDKAEDDHDDSSILAEESVKMSTEMFLQILELSEKYLINFTNENVNTVVDITELSDNDYLKLNITIGDKLKIRKMLAELATGSRGRNDTMDSMDGGFITRFKSHLSTHLMRTVSNLPKAN